MADIYVFITSEIEGKRVSFQAWSWSAANSSLLQLNGTDEIVPLLSQSIFNKYCFQIYVNLKQIIYSALQKYIYMLKHLVFCNV